MSFGGKLLCVCVPHFGPDSQEKGVGVIIPTITLYYKLHYIIL